MIRMGIVGSENSHTAAIAKLLNVDHKIADVQVVALWGETEEFARKAAEAGRIPTIVRDPADMIGNIDAVMIDHRHAKYHLPAAEPFLAAGLPMFIDKPFCFRSAEGRDFLARARAKGVPVTSFSTVPEQKSFAAFREEVAKAGPLQALVSTGPCDIDSPYGGVFFYGVHQVAAVLKIAGDNVAEVQCSPPGDDSRRTATLRYAGGPIITLNLLNGYKGGFHFLACCQDRVIPFALENDPDGYFAGALKFTTMFRTRVEPETHESLLAQVRVLEAMEKSLPKGKAVAVS
jgi:predicted dehydrogenase